MLLFFRHLVFQCMNIRQVQYVEEHRVTTMLFELVYLNAPADTGDVILA